MTSQISPATKKRILSGAKPTADSLHLGNYIGAVRNWVDMQAEYDAVFFIPDLHAITVDFDPAELAKRTRIVAAQYIAAGIDPDKSIFFVQSHVPEHAQLAWALNCITGFGEASRMTQFKDKTQKSGADAATLGLFAYPTLMAADILLYQTDLVPVGEDQVSHIELTREIAQRFNTRFGHTFTVPEATIVKESAKIYDLQNPSAKMSKTGESPNGAIQLLEDPKIAAKRIKSAVTDAGTEIRFDAEEKPGVSNLLTIYSSLTGKTIPELEAEYQGKMYGHLKVDLAEVMVEFVTPLRNRTNELMSDPAELDRLLAHGAERAREIASVTLAQVYERMGFLPSLSLAGVRERHVLQQSRGKGRSPFHPPGGGDARRFPRRACGPPCCGSKPRVPPGRHQRWRHPGIPAGDRGRAATLAGVLRRSPGGRSTGPHHAGHHNHHARLGGHPGTCPRGGPPAKPFQGHHRGHRNIPARFPGGLHQCGGRIRGLRCPPRKTPAGPPPP